MIQIDMQMPTNCLDCPACNEYLMCAIPANGRGWGENDVHEFDQGRPEWCPLKEQEAVIRCKDCKCYWEEANECQNLGIGAIKPDFFCAYANRKDGDGE